MALSNGSSLAKRQPGAYFTFAFGSLFLMPLSGVT